MQGVTVLVDHGVVVQGGRATVVFDPTRTPALKPSVVIVSHAHSDHYSLRALRSLPNTPIVMSRATREIIDPSLRLRNVVYIEDGEEVEVEGVRIEAFSSGHIVGSLQFLIELEGKRIVFTGDFNLEKRLVLKPASVVRADVVIIDGTYGSPEYVFPPRTELYRGLVEFVKSRMEEGTPVLLKGRRVGVAQELTALMYMSMDVVPLVEESVASVNRVYEKYGEWLGKYAPWVGSIPERAGPVITHLASRHDARLPHCLCTGWAVKGGGFPLSSHADFSQIVRYVRDSGAEVAIPFCGYRSELAESLKRLLGVEAYAEREVTIT